MNRLRFSLAIFISIGLSHNIFGQESINKRLDNLQVSVLTCGPGEELYSIFGHTALYLHDIEAGFDIVYNWGTFDFNSPNFGIKFLRGKLPYALSASHLAPFLNEYKIDERWVDEQILDLPETSKEKLLKALGINLTEENRYYKYDFYFDNCTTRIRDILEDALGNVQYPQLNDTSKTFRHLLHENLGHHPWTKFGMDIILGTLSDQTASSRGQMFLPSYFRDYLDNAKSHGVEVVSQRKNLLIFEHEKKGQLWWTPLTIFSILLILELIGLFMYYISGDKGFLLWFDLLWFISLSLASAIFLFMWYGTDHTVCANNWNLMWAPPWAFLILLGHKSSKRIGLCLTLLINISLIVGWSYLPQQLHLAILPLSLISILKSARLLGFKPIIDKYRKTLVILTLVLLGTLHLDAQDRLAGVTLVAPPQAYSSDPMTELVQVNANWVALVPFGFSRPGQPEVAFGSDRQWWGERLEGIKESIRLAKENGLNIMLKPQVWIPGDWVGNMDFESEAEWKKWEISYRDYIMTYVRIAIEFDVELLCIGTEYRVSVQKREKYWRDLIRDIRILYHGKLTYSSNWDSYDQMPFWDVLDYIGISAYFPLSEMDTPPALLLSYRWNKYIRRLKKFSDKHNKKILFTEFGYLSVDGAAGKTWELEKIVKTLDINEQAQANGYEALFTSFWKKDFWAGGFLWKWFPEGYGHEGYPERDYTPQNKKASEVLSRWYGKR